MTQNQIILYASYLCSCSRAIHSFLLYSEIPFTYHLQDYSKLKSPEYLLINPKGQVPAITDNDFNLSESTTILKYLCKTRPESKANKLYAQDPRLCAHIDELLDWYHCSLRKNAMGILFSLIFAKMLGKEPEPETKIKEYWINLERDLALIETTYLKDKEFILNGELSIADFMFATEIIALSLVQYDFNKHPTIKIWLQRMLELPGYFEAHENFFQQIAKNSGKVLYDLTKKKQYLDAQENQSK